MRIVFLLMFCLLYCCFNAIAQVPHAFTYQAIANEPSGNPIIDRDISVLIEVKGEGQESGLFAEQHRVQTSAMGTFSINIGRGEQLSNGNLPSAFRLGEKRYLHVSIDADGGTNYTFAGASEILSVPYAFYAEVGLNEQGRVGPAGVQGPAGEFGDPGLSPTDCCLGGPIKGEKGDPGAQGPDGPIGELGLSGLMTLTLTDDPPANPQDGQIYLDSGTNRQDGAPGFRYFDSNNWVDL